jgi:protein SCO1/2
MTIRTAIGLCTIAFGAVTYAWTRPPRASEAGVLRFPVTGIVVAAPEGRRVRVAHDEIPGYMAAMTMGFTLGEEETAALTPGDRIRFTLRVGPEGSRAEAVSVTGHGPLPAGEGVPLPPVTRVKRGGLLPELSLVDQDGRPIDRASFTGHPTVVTFIFTRCPVPEFCPLITSRFKEIQAALGSDPALPPSTQLLSITLDPAFDTPPILKQYGEAMGAHPARWRFATGTPDDVLRVSRAFSVHVERNGALLDHTLATALIDGSGRVVEIWRGNGWKTREVLEALRQER